MASVLTRIAGLIAIRMAEAVDGAGCHLGWYRVGRMIAVAFVAWVTWVSVSLCSSSLMHLLRCHAQRHVCGHGVTSPAAQRQQDHHESEHKKTHGLNHRG